MSFHIKCFFGCHDWETINSITEREILESMDDKLAEDKLKSLKYNKSSCTSTPISSNGVWCEQEICLRCCAIKDDVAKYLRNFNGEKFEIEFEKFHTERRQKQAKSMSKSCAADKFVRI